jgi:hypothetical protein
MYRGPIGVMMRTTPPTSFSIHMLNLPGVRFSERGQSAANSAPLLHQPRGIDKRIPAAKITQRGKWQKPPSRSHQGALKLGKARALAALGCPKNGAIVASQDT